MRKPQRSGKPADARADHHNLVTRPMVHAEGLLTPAAQLSSMIYSMV
jgi:hypothetical protein